MSALSEEENKKRDARAAKVKAREDKPLEVRFWAKVSINSGCWLWQGTTRNGYGCLMVDGRREYAHRVAYRLLVGVIEDSSEIDHLCHNADKSCPGAGHCEHRRCVRPDHLEATTHAMNCARGRAGAYLKGRTECKHGHAYTPANTIIEADGHRRCRTCVNKGRQAANARFRQRHPEYWRKYV